jgi:UDP-glucose 4-epimerase
VNYFQKKIIAITGSSGFIGTTLVSALSQQEADLRLLVRTKNSNIPYSQTKCDIVIDEIPLDFFRGVNTIIHLAGSAHDTYSKHDEDFYLKINVAATIKLAEAALVNNVKNFIFISSVKAGDEHSYEKLQIKNKDFYAYTKRKAEIDLINMLKETDVRLSIIRPSLVYGPSVKGNLNSMMTGIKQGWFPPLPNIQNRKSMIHIDDLVMGIMFVLENSKKTGEVYIITDGQYYSSREVYETMCGIIGKPVPRWSVPFFIFKLIGLIHPKIKQKVNKLFLDTSYSSKKIEELGYEAHKTLKDMNESLY